MTDSSCCRFSRILPHCGSFHKRITWPSSWCTDRRHRELEGVRKARWKHVSRQEKVRHITRYPNAVSFLNDAIKLSNAAFTGSVICAYGRGFTYRKRQSCWSLETQLVVVKLQRKAEQRGEGLSERGKERLQTRVFGKDKRGETHSLREDQNFVRPFTASPAERQFGQEEGCGMEWTRPLKSKIPSARYESGGDLPSTEGDKRRWSQRHQVYKDDRMQQREDMGELGGNTDRLSKPAVGQSVHEIPPSDMMKIQELRFSGDLWEGDSGPQVLNLQRALYWFGHLPDRSYLTAYFGPETKKALQHFQTGHGVPVTGIWGSHSRQALWKHLCAGTRNLPEGGLKVQSNPQPVPSLLNRFPFAKNIAARGINDAVHGLDSGCARHFQEFISAPCWKHVPTTASMVGLSFVMAIGLLHLSYLVVGRAPGQHGQPVRRRILKAHWRDDDVRGGPHTRAKKHLDFIPRVDRPLDKDGDPKFPNYQLRVKSKPSPRDAGARTDRLIIYEGQVILGDHQPKTSLLRNVTSGLHGATDNAPDSPPKARVPSYPVLASAEQVPDTKKVKVPNNESQQEEPNAPEVGRESSLGASQVAGEDPVPPAAHDNSYRNGLPSWIGNLLLALFTPRGLRQPLPPDMPVSRKAIMGNTVPVEPNTTDRGGLTDARSESKAPSIQRRSRVAGAEWQHTDEVDLRERVEELRKTVQSAEQNRQAAMRALAEERQRSLELQVKISRQKEAAVALEEEVRVLKESHDALLASLRKKYSSSVAARAAAALLYQNWDTNHGESRAEDIASSF